MAMATAMVVEMGTTDEEMTMTMMTTTGMTSSSAGSARRDRMERRMIGRPPASPCLQNTKAEMLFCISAFVCDSAGFEPTIN
jgi:hypothetical protein